MTSEEAYIHFTNLVEKNSTNNNLNIDKARFVEWYNFTSPIYQNELLDKRNEDAIREMAPFLKNSDDLELVESTEEYDTFEKPIDFFELSNVFITASKGVCTSKDIILSEIKAEDVHISISDINLKPSYKARESFYHLLDEGVSIYHISDFEIKSARMLYYIQIPKIDIEGYDHLDGSSSVNIDPVTDDRTTIKILQMMAVLFVTAEGNLNNYQANLANLKQL